MRQKHISTLGGRMIFFQTDGLRNTDLRPKGPIPLYLTDFYEVIEGPSYWVFKIAQLRSRSLDTLKQYTTTLAAFLQWLDDESDGETHLGATAWEQIDEDTINAYIADLIEDRDEKGRPNDSTIEAYIARLGYFYKWAREHGYTPYWEFNEETVKANISSVGMMLSKEIEVQRRPVKLQSGTPIQIERERDKFIRREELPKVYVSFDDIVYRLIAHVFFTTGLRPKELFQLPYMGKGLNIGLKRYREEELETLQPIMFEFESKGKRRHIDFPPDLWAYICRVWMPLRVERAEKYKQRYGVYPSVNALFLSVDGRIVTRKMLRDNFNKAAAKDSCPVKKLYPYQLRHAFATYFVFDRLKALNLLGKKHEYNAVIDDELRRWMGHTDVKTTYKYYVDASNRYLREDLLTVLEKPENKELLDAILKL